MTDSAGQTLQSSLTVAKQQRLVGWRKAHIHHVDTRCVNELVEAQAARRPNATAVVSGNYHLSYALLNQRATALARYLRTQGVRPEVRVGICVERSDEMVVALLAVLKAGGAFVPLDPSYPVNRLTFMLRDSATMVLLTSSVFAEKLSPCVSCTVCLDTDDWWGESQTQLNVDLNSESVVPSDIAYVNYTSGSTGAPKGVMIEHRSVVSFLTSVADEIGITESDTLLALTTLSFDISILEIFLPLSVGARVVVATREAIQDTQVLASTIAASGATIVQATPTTWQQLVDSGWQSNTSLRILCGGEPLSPTLATQLATPEVSLFNLYGPTEATIWSTIDRFDSDDTTVSIGRPLANTFVCVLDTNQELLTQGGIGEIYIGGLGLARGYVNRADLTSKQFPIISCFGIPSSRMYRTGDLGRYLPDGRIEYIGRIDHQVKIRGHRIEPGEVEEAIRKVARVRDVVVVGRQDTFGDTRLIAYIVTIDRSDMEVSDLRNEIASTLPEFMIPSTFVFIERFPTTLNGKIDRNALPTPNLARPSLEAEYTPPRTPVEKWVADVWSVLLGIAYVGVHDNFFELGGHSLLLARLGTRIATSFDIQLPLRQLLDLPTVADMAVAIAEAHIDMADHQRVEEVLEEVEMLPAEAVQRLLWEYELNL